MVVSEIERDLSPRRMSGEDQLSCFIGAGATFSGEMVFHGVMHLDGHFSGLISSPRGTLVVGAGSEIDASVEVATAEVHGTVKGDLSALESVRLSPTASVVADIETPSLVIQDGAIFEGRCRMSGGPSAAMAVRRKLRTRKT